MSSFTFDGSNNSIKTLLFNENKFQRLDFPGLLEVPIGIEYLHALETLELNSNSISTVDDKIGLNRNLNQLELTHNNVSSISQAIHKLDKLIILELENNQIVQFPNVHLAALQELNLSHNMLTTLPDSFSYYSNLKELNLDENDFTILPEPICGIQSLEYLSLANNEIVMFGDCLWGLQNLITLYLNDNIISDSLRNDLYTMGSLRFAYFFNNQISGHLPTVPISAPFRRLHLYNNNLTGCFPCSLGDYFCDSPYQILLNSNPELPGGGNWNSYCGEGLGACN